MSDAEKELISHCLKEARYGWGNFLDGKMGAGNERDHLSMVAAILRNALGHIEQYVATVKP
jgi:hypothetical protein